MISEQFFNKWIWSLLLIIPIFGLTFDEPYYITLATKVIILGIAGVGLNLAKGAVIGALFIVMGRFSATLSTNSGLHPFLGAWLPNLLFIGVVIYLIRNAQK